jgi:hypothetical protein
MPDIPTTLDPDDEPPKEVLDEHCEESFPGSDPPATAGPAVSSPLGGILVGDAVGGAGIMPPVDISPGR